MKKVDSTRGKDVFNHYRGVVRKLIKSGTSTTGNQGHQMRMAMAQDARANGKPPYFACLAGYYPYGDEDAFPTKHQLRPKSDEYKRFLTGYKALGFTPVWFKNKYPNSPLSKT